MKKGLAKKLEDIFAAAAFAEAGEHETAREMLKEKSQTIVDSTIPSKGKELMAIEMETDG